MNGICSALDWRLIGIVAFALLMFGAYYDSLMTRLADHKDPYISIFVAGGVAVTLGLIAVIDWRAAVLALGAFACSGLPMVAGSIRRNMERQKQAIDDLRRLWK